MFPCEFRCQVNGDNNVVGWFRSTSLRGGFCDLKSVETHFMFEKRIGNAIYLVYDPVLSASSGCASIRVRCVVFAPGCSLVYVNTAVHERRHCGLLRNSPRHTRISTPARAHGLQ